MTGLRGWAALAAVTVTVDGSRADAQTLRGSPASVDMMYWHARSADLPFYRTRDGMLSGVFAGRLVMVAMNEDLELARVRYPFVLPGTRDFVYQLARRYRQNCGERLVLTSALRPITEQPRNAHAKSVHPAGMAVDFRRPQGRCLEWLRAELLDLEARRVIEATEERRPPHFHVAVLRPDTERRLEFVATGDVETAPVKIATPPPLVRVAPTVVLAPPREAFVRGPSAEAVEQRRAAAAATAPRRAGPAAGARGSPAPAAPSAGRYVVRNGDTLWGIARRHNTTPERLQALNNLRGSRIRPGQTLRVR
jgi:hypothetical protein